MSDDGGGDCGGGDSGGGCDDTGGGSYEAGGGNDECTGMDPADCTDITFTENVDYVGGFYSGGGVNTCHHVHHGNYSRHHTYITDTKERIILFIVVMAFCILICELNIN